MYSQFYTYMYQCMYFSRVPNMFLVNILNKYNENTLKK